MTNKQEWYHGRITGLTPKGDIASDEVPYSSMSVAWLRNHLNQKASELIRVHGFRYRAQDDPNTIVLLHPTRDNISFLMSIEACSRLDPDCQGECLYEEVPNAGNDGRG